MSGQYATPKGTRSEIRTSAGRFRGGKMIPVMAHAFRENEGGMYNFGLSLELDPIAGRVITEINAHIVSVFVPALGLDNIKNATDDYAGNKEIYREKLLANTPVFDLEEEGIVSKFAGVMPRSVSGIKYVNEVVRLAYNVANNHLRQIRHIDTTLVDKDSAVILPALLSSTALARFNAVLDPEDRINGSVDLLGGGTVGLPIVSSHKHGAAYGSPTVGAMDYTMSAPTGTPVVDGTEWKWTNIYADISDAGNGSVSLKDFYNAEQMDQLTRYFAEVLKANPEHGEDMIMREVHGLQVETGKVPFILYEREGPLNNGMARGMDGPNLDTFQTDIDGNITFTVPVPRTELGGVVITMIAVKPDETIPSQPHPFLSEVWTATNHVADELAVDPVAVTLRDLHADCDTANEGDIAFYTGNNHMKRVYQNYGFNRDLDRTTVANKTAIWQYEIPLSVTPESVLYPADLDHYPFQDQTADVVQYTASSSVTIATPLIMGPSPIEELSILDSEDVFEENTP